MATIGSLVVNLSAATAQFGSGMQRAGRTVLGFEKTVIQTASNVESRLGGLMAATAAAFGLRSLTKSIDETGDMSDRIGIATEKLIGLRHAADMSGASAEQLDMALGRMVKRIGAAAQNGGSAAESFTRIGLSAQELVALAPDQQFEQIADAIAAIDNPTQRAAAAVSLFGRSGLDVLTVMSEGSAGLRKFQNEAEALGLTFSRDAAEKVGQFNDAVAKSGAVIKMVFGRALIAVAPILKSLADGVARAAAGFNSLSPGMQRAMAAAALTVPVMIALAKTLKLVAVSAALVQALTGAGIAKALAGLAVGAASFVVIGKMLEGSELDAIKAAQGMGQVGAAATDMAAGFDLAAKSADDLKQRSKRLENAFKQLADLQRELQQHGFTEGDKLIAGLREAGAGPDATAMARGLLDRQAMLKRADAIEEMVRKLDQEAAQAGLTADQIKLLELAHLGASSSTIDYARTLIAEADAFTRLAEQRKELEQFGKSLTESTREPIEKFIDQVRRMRDALQGGFIGAGVFGRGMAAAQETLLKDSGQNEFGNILQNQKLEAFDAGFLTRAPGTDRSQEILSRQEQLQGQMAVALANIERNTRGGDGGVMVGAN